MNPAGITKCKERPDEICFNRVFFLHFDHWPVAGPEIDKVNSAHQSQFRQKVFLSFFVISKNNRIFVATNYKTSYMEDSGLNIYLDEIGRESLLSAEEERELSERILQGDKRAMNKLVEANLRFVVAIASQYKGRGLQMEDLVSEGNFGLMKAAAKFDASKGTRFVNYAVVHVRRSIEKAIDQQAGLYQVPKDVKDEVVARQQSHALSVDAPLGYRTNMSLLSVLINQDAPLADERVHSEAIEEAIEFALGTLDERESRVVNAFFGITQEHETMAEIAEDMELKRERVRQIRDKAVRKLRKAYHRRLKELHKQ